MSLSIDACVDVDSREVRRLIDLQLGVSLADAATISNSIHVSISCAGTEITMYAWNPPSGQRANRTVPLGATTVTARPRLLAITAVELAATVLVEGLPPSPQVPAVSPSQIVADDHQIVSAPVAQRSASRRLLAFGGAVWFPKLGNLQAGGFRVAWDSSGIASASIGAQIGFGRISTIAGNVAVTSLSLNPVAGLHYAVGRYTLRAGTGPHLAVGRLHGEVPPGSTDLATTFTAPWLGWSQQLGVEAIVARHMAVGMTVESGYVLAPLVGKIRGERRVNIEGAWVGVFLSFGVRTDDNGHGAADRARVVSR